MIALVFLDSNRFIGSFTRVVSIFALPCQVLSTPGAPLVHSISWGTGEQDMQKSDMHSGNVEFQKLGAVGVTVLVASGDEVN